MFWEESSANVSQNINAPLLKSPAKTTGPVKP